ncbi:MAG: ABC transporter substrate-binding protein [Corynebacterium variabile]
MTGTPDVEKVAEADPDVIFAGYLPDQATYDRFNQIAPTIATVGSSPMSDDWREATTVAGDILGRSDDAKSLIEDAEQAFTDARENHPALDGATGAFGQISEQGLAMVTGDADTDAAMAISNPTILSAVWELEQLEDTFTALDDAAE